MAESENRSVHLEETLKPFYQRASQAEDRLSSLEAALASKKDSANEEYSELVNELQSKLKDACAEIALEQDKNKKLAAENAKLQYRIKHLVQAVRNTDEKLEQSMLRSKENYDFLHKKVNVPASQPPGGLTKSKSGH